MTVLNNFGPVIRSHVVSFVLSSSSDESGSTAMARGDQGIHIDFEFEGIGDRDNGGRCSNEEEEEEDDDDDGRTILRVAPWKASLLQLLFCNDAAEKIVATTSRRVLVDAIAGGR